MALPAAWNPDWIQNSSSPCRFYDDDDDDDDDDMDDDDDDYDDSYVDDNAHQYFEKRNLGTTNEYETILTIYSSKE